MPGQGALGEAVAVHFMRQLAQGADLPWAVCPRFCCARALAQSHSCCLLVLAKTGELAVFSIYALGFCSHHTIWDSEEAYTYRQVIQIIRICILWSALKKKKEKL